MIAAFVLLAAQPAAAETVQVPTCSLVTPRGDAISFFIWGDTAPANIRLSALPGSVWPAGTVVAVPAGQGNSSFTLGGRRGLTLELGGSQAGGSRAVTVFARENSRAALPIAYGFCKDQQVTANPPEPAPDREAVGAENAAFDASQWPEEDCALLLSDGRRIRFDPTLQGRTDDLQLASADLWGGRPATVRVRWSDVNGTQVGQFGEANQTQGVRIMIVNGTRGAELYRFQNLGDPALAGVSGYGICGHRRVVARGRR